MDWWDAIAVHGGAAAVSRDEQAYPYPASEKFPDDANAIEYQLNWNDRFDSGEPVRSYRFDYRVMHRRRRMTPLLCRIKRPNGEPKIAGGKEQRFSHASFVSV